MFKRAITYTDLFEDKEVTNVFYFHLSKAELIDMEMSEEGGLSAMLTQVTTNANGAEIMQHFKNIIKAAYGERQGDKFVKSPEIADAFLRSPAFDVFLTDLMTDEKLAVEFVNELMPKDLGEMVAKLEAANKTRGNGDLKLPEGGDTGAVFVGHPPYKDPRAEASGLNIPWDDKGQLVPWWDREPTPAELVQMSPPQTQDVWRRKASGWVPRTPAS